MNEMEFSNKPRQHFAGKGVSSLVRFFFAVVVLLVGGLVWGPPSDVAYAAGARVTICHRTSSVTNPYRLITISNSAANAHDNHAGSAPGGVWDVTKAKGTWGDIVPGPRADADAGQFWSDATATSANLNWGAAGKAFMLPGGENVSKCRRMTALKFYEISKAAGDSDATIATDLNDQKANEDLAVKPIGGWTPSNVVTSVGGVSITTNNPSAVGSTSASLNGTIVAGTTSTTPIFEYGTTTSLGTTISGGSPATGTISATASLTGLGTNTTYYYRLIGEIGSTDTLGTYYGGVLSFTTGKTSRTVTVAAASITLASSATTTLSTTVSAGTTGATTYTVVTGILYCSISGTTLTADGSNGGTCSISAEDAGSSTYNPAVSDTISITVTSASRTLTLGGDSGSYGFTATPPTMTATASAADSSGVKSFSSATTGVCTVNSSTGVVTFVSAGTCTISSEITAGGGYVSAVATSRSFTVTSATTTTVSSTTTTTVSSTTTTTVSSTTTATTTSTVPRTTTVSKPKNNTKRTLLLSGNDSSYGFAAKAPTMVATPSAGKSSGTKSFSSATTGVCTVNSSTGVVTFVSAGTCTIGSEITAGGEFASASATSRSFSVAASITVSTTNPNRTTTTTTVSISRPNATTTVPPINAVDLGSGPLPSTSVVPPSGGGSTTTTQVLSTDSGSNAKRSIDELRSEKIKGFEPGSGVSVDVIGTRTLGQFAVLPTGTVDNIAIAAALLESTNRTATDFARIKEAKAVQEPSANELKTTNQIKSTDADMSQQFKDSELVNPVRMSDLSLPQDGKWIKVTLSVTTYKPGSIIYLTITSNPIVISEALVDQFGNAVVTGLFPAEIVGNGLHRIRVVGTRRFDDVVVNKKGEITLTESIIAEIVRFDMQSSATIRSTGANLSGGNNTAVRVVPLRAPLPWWTLWICGLAAFLGLILKLNRKLHLVRQLIVGSVVLVVSAFPAQYYGWTQIAYPVMYWGIGVALLGIVLLWIVPSFGHREYQQVPDAASVQ